ncbi:MAG: flagella basal body P-ring formation protein FlgA, partial [Myxococcota bacterium]|nr:flagella basal body P-ring formation protein FlgA [Myxococcota bacterium]
VGGCVFFGSGGFFLNFFLSVSVLCFVWAALDLQPNAANRVWVKSDRIFLGDVLTNVPAAAAKIVLGPSPKPGESRVLFRGEIHRKLKDSHVALGDLTVPKKVRVTRRAKLLAEPRLRNLVKRALSEEFGKIYVVDSVSVSGAMKVSQGRLSLRVKRPIRVRPGTRSMRVSLFVNGRKERAFLVRAVLRIRPELVGKQLKRGASVSVVLNGVRVRIKTRGTLQAPAWPGEVVKVRTDTGARFLRGIYVGDSVVEVRL